MELLKNLEGLSADEQMTAVVELQKAAMKHLEEQKQASIGKSAELVIQGLKKIKSDFEAKFDSLNYDIQTKVASLKDGEQGLQGPKGDQGARGLDGSNGRDGRDGKDGKDGIDGVDGVGVRDAKIDFDGSLVISLTDGREINCGEVVSVDVAKQIQKVTHNIQTGAGGDSQTVLDAIAAIQATIATYGTMATQNANNVAITGGAINNTTIGATTPNTGVFTTLVGNSTSEFGKGSANYFRFTGNTTGNGPTLRFTGSDSNIDGIYAVRGTGAHRFFTNDNNQQQFQVSHTASAVNYVQVTGAATGAEPVISAQGSDSNIRLILRSKGSLGIRLQDAVGNTSFATATGGGSNFIQTAGTATTFGPVLSAAGGDTNIPLVLQPKGTGALQAQQTDSTATGGNARGANAVDWQTLRNGAGQVASGQNSFIGGGGYSTAAGAYSSVVTGFSNTANATVACVLSGQSNVVVGNYAVIAGGVSNAASGWLNFIGGGFTNSGTANAAVTTQSATMNGTTAVTLSGSNASIKVGQYITGTSIAADTYVAAVSGTSLTLSKVASGSSTSTLSFYTPHGVVVGGGNNQATGAYSFIGGGGDAGTAANRNVASGDWSFVGGGIKNQATGIGSFVGGGGSYGSGFAGNTASGTSTFVGSGYLNTAGGFAGVVVGGSSNIQTLNAGFIGGGANNTVNSSQSVISGGTYGTTRSVEGSHVFPAHNNPVASASGVSQGALLILGVQTTDATATVLRSNTSAAGTTNQVILPNNSAYYFKGTVIANVTGGGNTKGWTIEGAIKRGANAASTALVGTPTVVSAYADAGAATWAITATADTTNGGLAITFTGQAGTTIRVVAKLETTEVTF